MKKSSARFSTLVAVSGGLAALPAAALELGEAKISSSLHQPLRASIAYALGPNEALSNTCVSLQGGLSRSGMPGVGPATISVADGVISITGKSAVREPLISMRVNVSCPYTAQLSREYVLFVDPASTTPQTAESGETTAAPSQAAVAPAPVALRLRPVNNEPIGRATRYRVQPGDSLSQIVERIENRPVGHWPAIHAIFDANSDAFVDNDPNQLKAGSWLSIPDFGADSPLTFANSSTAYPGISIDRPAADIEAQPVSEPVASEPVAAKPVVSEPVVISPIFSDDALADFADLQPGDIIVDSSADDSSIVIPDTALEGPETTSTSPNVPTATVQATPAESPSTNWLMWLAGAGAALIAGLLFFGRLVRERFGSSPIGQITAPQRRRTDNDTQKVEAIGDVDISLPDDSPTEENLALDADLVIGTGLQHGSDVDIAQDFGFSATTELDLELPEDMSSGIEESLPTDIIPPINVDIESILESEVLPEEIDDGNGDYDMSVIVDATKMPRPEDVTERDLEAIEVETSDESLIADDYMVSHDGDYKVLEQDYEDEFTATQALNEEIARAAEELALRMDVETGDDSEDSSDISLASVTALDLESQSPAENDDSISDLDDTGINEAITVEMPADDKTAEMPPIKKDRTG